MNVTFVAALFSVAKASPKCIPEQLPACGVTHRFRMGAFGHGEIWGAESLASTLMPSYAPAFTDSLYALEVTEDIPPVPKNVERTLAMVDSPTLSLLTPELVLAHFGGSEGTTTGRTPRSKARPVSRCVGFLPPSTTPTLTPPRSWS